MRATECCSRAVSTHFFENVQGNGRKLLRSNDVSSMLRKRFTRLLQIEPWWSVAGVTVLCSTSGHDDFFFSWLGPVGKVEMGSWVQIDVLWVQ